MAFLRHHSPSSDHELLLRDFQGQENDHERQEENELSWAENDQTSEDGGEQEKKKQGIHIYARQLAGAGAGRSPAAHLEDIKSEHQDHHFSVSDLGDTKEVSPYHHHHHHYYSYPVPLLDVTQLPARRRAFFVMAILSAASLFFILRILLVTLWPASLVDAVPRPQTDAPPPASDGYWLASIPRNGKVAYGDSSFQIYRNVKEFGAKGDGSTDDTVAINNAISSGARCGENCDSSTVKPAIVYFPAGTYVVSKPIIQYYYTQFIGDPLNLPVIKAASNFEGIAVLDTDPYIPGGNGKQWYTNQNNFFRQIRNFVVDITAMPIGVGAGMHWQVAQATSLQNIRFEMIKGGGAANKQQGIFMDNGSGGFMSDLVFNGGLFGAFFGNQQFTTRNLTFNDCQTAIYMNWNWLWTFKSVDINNCQIGIDMSNSPANQTVGSILLLDSKFTNTPTAIKTAFSGNSIPETGGTLVIDNVDFTGAQTAVADNTGNTILAGGSVVSSWAQGSAYQPSGGAKLMAKRLPQAPASPDTCSSSSMAAAASSSPAVGGSSTTVTPVVSGGSTAGVPSSGTALPAPTSSAPFGNGTQFNVTAQACSAPPSPKSRNRIQEALTGPTKPGSLLSGDKVFERSKPQYEKVPLSAFVSVKSQGAKGDGKTDDTAAIQKIFNSATTDQIVYFDHGAYVITDTVDVPKNIKITGEIWPLIMASGPAFSDQNNPKPVFRVGAPGDRGAVEITDLMFETLGPAPGAILMEWNVADSSQGSCAMWDVHFRVGGTAGTGLQIDKCQKNENVTTSFKPECAGAYMLMHVTQQATAYFENTWFWVADHELDLSTWPNYQYNNQINIYNGRGILVESQGPVWLYGTSSEHSQLYNYQISNAKDIWMGSIQTETAYMQANPNALDGGFAPNPAFSDPDFATCTTDSCKKTWGMRVVDSSDVYLYGGGLYSFFENYRQQCLDTESCQENMIDIQCSQDVWLYGVSTKASVNMVTVNGQSQALGLDNDNGFCQTVALFQN